MQKAIDETNRRAIQEAYNKEHGIVPKTIVKNIRDNLRYARGRKEDAPTTAKDFKKMTQEQRREALSYSSWICVRQPRTSISFEKAADVTIFELRAEYRL